MSHNKDIKLLHELTGWSYKECRRQMKANHWDLGKALPFSEVLDKLPEIISNTLEVMCEAINLVAITCQDFINQLLQAINESTSNVEDD